MDVCSDFAEERGGAGEGGAKTGKLGRHIASITAKLSALASSSASETRQADCGSHGEYLSTAYKLGERVLHWSACPQCAALAKQQAKQAAAQQEAEQRQRRLEARMNQSGIPLRYRDKGFADFVAEGEEQQQALARAREFADNFASHHRRGTVLVFSGLPGTGKSHLANCIARQVMASHTAFYTSAIDAVRRIRDTWRRDATQTETQVLHMLAGIDLLILDEVGMQYGTEAEQITLFDIIDKRYRDLKPTILLTNQNSSGLKQFLGERSFDRVKEECIWVTFLWASHRGKR